MGYINEDEIATIEEKKRDASISIGYSSVIGSREEQQDAVLACQNGEHYIGVVCDGMGGLQGGAAASRNAIDIIKEDFQKLAEEENIPEFLEYEVRKIDRAIESLTDPEGNLYEAGTTIVAVIVFRQKMYWISVGDSKIFFIRDGRAFPLTREHNYKLSLDIMKRRGLITEQEYLTETAKGEALISYLGVGNLRLFDSNIEGIPLEFGDRILLCSDGLYKYMDEEDILSTVRSHGNAQDAAAALTDAIEYMGKNEQDNTSVVLVQYM